MCPDAIEEELLKKLQTSPTDLKKLRGPSTAGSETTPRAGG